MSDRILDIFIKLSEGEALSVKDLSSNYKKTDRTILRDLKTIDEVIKKYDKSIIKSKGKYIIDSEGYTSPHILLAIIKIILESRAFNSKEISQVLTEIIKRVSSKDKDFIVSSIKDELHFYKPLDSEKDRIKIIWDLETFIQNGEVLMFLYDNHEEMIKEHIIGRPISIFFDNFYFYVLVLQKNGYKILHLDWIDNIEKSTKKISLTYSSKLRIGEHRNNSHFNYLGNLTKIKFEYYGLIDYVKDRFPNCKIILVMDKENPVPSEKALGKPVYLVEIEVEYSVGIEMWLLSNIYESRVLSPNFVVNRIKNIIYSSIKWYE